MALYVEFSGRRRRRINTELDIEALPGINEFLKNFSQRQGWNGVMAERLNAVAEETVMLMLDRDEEGEKKGGRKRRLLIFAGGQGLEAELEFVSAPRDAGNLEDRIAMLHEHDPEIPDYSVMEREVSIRLLQHYASSVSHRQYHETEVITVRVTLNSV